MDTDFLELDRSGDSAIENPVMLRERHGNDKADQIPASFEERNGSILRHGSFGGGQTDALAIADARARSPFVTTRRT